MKHLGFKKVFAGAMILTVAPQNSSRRNVESREHMTSLKFINKFHPHTGIEVFIALLFKDMFVVFSVFFCCFLGFLFPCFFASLLSVFLLLCFPAQA
jgi:hypothetical protein